MATLNIGLKVNRAITGATTVNTNSYAIVSYQGAGGSASGSGFQGAGGGPGIVTRYFGPGQSIPNTFSDVVAYYSTTTSVIAVSATFTLLGGVEFSNTQ